MEPEYVSMPAGDNPPKATLYYGDDVRTTLRTLPDKSVHCVATSPPYYALRDYGNPSSVWGGNPACNHQWGTPGSKHRGGPQGKSEALHNRDVSAREETRDVSTGQFCPKCNAWFGQLGLEPSPELFIHHLVEIFQEVKRVLRDDGVLWLNLGDSYAGYHGNAKVPDDEAPSNKPGYVENMRSSTVGVDGLKQKDLIGIPWMAAFALRADGWYLRSEVIWAKANPMPESVTDRPTKAHEQIFLLTKSPTYFYDADAIREQWESLEDHLKKKNWYKASGSGETSQGKGSGHNVLGNPGAGRNKRSVWKVSTKAYWGAHFATMPTDLVEPMIKSGSSEFGCCSGCGAPWKRDVETTGGRDWRNDRMVEAGVAGEILGEGSYKRGRSKEPLNDVKQRIFKGWQPTCECEKLSTRCTVLDPFSGSATTGLVAMRLDRNYIGIDLNPSYLPLAKARLLDLPPPSQDDPVEDDQDDFFQASG